MTTLENSNTRASERIISAPRFRSSIDRPPGRTDHALSAITRTLITYFTPDRLSELLDRSYIAVLDRSRSLPRETALLLIRAAATCGPGCVDASQAMRLYEVVVAGRKWSVMDELLELGRSISPRAHAPRTEIVFSGGPIAALAEHVYAPYDAIPMLLETLAEDLKKIPNGIDPAALSAVIGFYCVHMHPFIDGNGRWSRTIAASSACTEDNPLPSFINIAFQRVCERQISTIIWPNSRTAGLRSYIEAAIEFEKRVVKGLGDAGFCEQFSRFCTEIAGRGPSQSSKKLIAELVCNGSIAIERMREACGMSNRIVNGLKERFEDPSGYISFGAGRISIEVMLEHVSAVLSGSKVGNSGEMVV